MLYVGMDGWMAWDGMVIIGHGYSKRTLGANKSKTMEWNLTDNCFYLLDNFSELPTIQTLGNIFGGVPAFRMHFCYCVYFVLCTLANSTLLV